MISKFICENYWRSGVRGWLAGVLQMLGNGCMRRNTCDELNAANKFLDKLDEAMPEPEYVLSIPGLFPVYHVECKGIAFYTKRKWKSGDMILATQITLLDGTRPVAFSSPVCGSCQEPPATLTFEKPHGK